MILTFGEVVTNRMRIVWILVSALLMLAGTGSLLATSSSPVHRSARRSQSHASITGQSTTLLPDGTLLVLGGEGPDGPTSAAKIQNPQTGRTITLPVALNRPRTGHTATMLPNGTILVFGGFGASGAIESIAEIFDPATSRFEICQPKGLSPRAYHSASILTDGRLLVVGGVSESGATIGTIELWDFRTDSTIAMPTGLLVPRKKHTARLLADGSILLWGGTDAHGAELTFGEVFDPLTQRTRMETNPASLSTNSQIPGVAASFPQDKARDVPIDALISVRFTERLDVPTLNSQSVSISDMHGSKSARVVAVEDGMLIFLSPNSVLENGSMFTVTINGASNLSRLPLAPSSFSFTTAPPSSDGSDKSNSGDTPWVPNASNFDGNWKSGDVKSTAQKLPPLQAKKGITALAGQTLRLNGSPLEGVTLRIDSQKATTDNTGRFLLEHVSEGHHALLIDGTTANKHGKDYGIFEAGVDIVAGQTTALNYTIWMTPLDMNHAVTIPSPTTTETVVSTPLLPGLELHLPPGTVIRDHNGKVVTKLSITPVPIDHPPFPLPVGVNVPIYFTIQPGAAYIEVSGGYAKGARLFYPNSHHAARGTSFNFWNYDADQKGWYVYGKGTVAKDGKQIVPDPGVEIYEFTGAMVGQQSVAPTTGATAPPVDGEPVNLSTGLFVYNKTDLVESDVIPLTLQRTYRTNDSQSRSFGIGATQYYEMFIVGDIYPYTFQELILPDGSRIFFHNYAADGGTIIPNAVYVHTSSQSIWYGATITWNQATNSGWVLRRKDGMKFFFPEATAATNPGIMALIKIQDRYGNVVEIDRDASGNVTKVSSPNGRYITFQSDTSNRITQAKDSIGRTVSYAYDTSGRLSTVTDANSGVTTYTYDSNNNMLTVQDPRGITYLTNQFDSDGRVTQQTLADGGTYQFAWTPTTTTALTYATYGGSSGLPTGGSGTEIINFRSCTSCSEGYMPLVSQVDVTDPRSNVRRVQFGSTGQVTSDTRAYGTSNAQALTFTYYADNLIKSVTDQLGRETDYSYDENGNATSVTRLAGTSNAVTTTFTYDPNFSQIASVTDPLSHTTSFTIDGSGNTTTISDPLSHQTTVAYNSQGQATSVTDALSHTTQFAYDSGDLISITDPLSRVTQRFTDSAGRVLSVTNPLGQTTRMAYNALNQVTSTTDPKGGVSSFTYDANGNLLTVTDANSHTTTYTYNNMDWVSTRTDALTHGESYTYDHNGNLTQFTDRRGKIAKFTYDELNRVTFAGYGWTTGTTYESTITNTYDAGNRLTQSVDSVSGTIGRVYDGLNRLTSETTPGSNTVSYTYDTASRRSSLTMPGQTATNYTYDNANRLTQIAQGTTTISFSYDNGNRRTTLTLPNGITTTSSYNNASELTGLTYANGGTTLGTLTYTYDSAGRRTNVGGTYAASGLPNAVSTTVYNANNQLTTWGTANLFYDSNGNMTSDGTHSFTWNARNLLSQIDSGTTANFVYDPFGRRTSKTISSTQTGFIYDVANPAQELSGSTVTANSLTGGVDEVFQRTDSAGARSFLTDGLGSTLALTNSSGTLLTTYSFEPFGNTTVSGSSTTNAFAYTGREIDTGNLYYYRARYYNSQIQRFISEDPLGFGANSVNFYEMVYDSPTNYRDPSGMQTMVAEPIAVGAGAGAAAGTAAGAGAAVSAGAGGFSPTFSLIVGGSAEGGAAGGPLGVAVGVVAGLGVYDGIQAYKLCQAYGGCGVNPSLGPLPAGTPMAGRNCKDKAKTAADCWNEFAADLQACASAYPPGPQRLACYEAARKKLQACRDSIGPLPVN
jgi:RHS repeat-associated protein